MRSATFLILVSVILSCVMLRAVGAQSGPPVIHRVTLQATTGVLNIAGTGLGADLLVMLDGQPISVLPGATATQIDALVPPSVLATPGTFRLTVVDPVRQVGDAFVVASLGGRVADGNAVTAQIAGSGSPLGAAGSSTAAPVTLASGRAAATIRGFAGGSDPLVTENSGFPFTRRLWALAHSSPTSWAHTTRPAA
jgi:hypothetical protein